tara:strand:+ start:1616 stop:1909 length:294 start_codon:yes stop_codon:yes gene_type:complete
VISPLEAHNHWLKANVDSSKSLGSLLSQSGLLQQTDGMANKPWFQATIHSPGTGFALLVIAFCLLIQTIPSAICVLTPRTGWDPPLSPERVRYCKGG